VDTPSVSPPLTGFNNNVRYRGMRFHIQTEDSGVTRPHIITHLFADGGHVIKSVRTDYAEHLDDPDRPGIVSRMMREQHRNMALDLRDGRLDDTIDRLRRSQAAHDEDAQHDGAPETQQQPARPLAASAPSPSSSDPSSAPPVTVVSGRNEPCETARESEPPARNRRPSRAPDPAKRRSVAPKPRRSQPPPRKKLGRPSPALATKPSADSIFGAAPQESLDDVILGYVSHTKNDPDTRGRK
jgi:hypothetical protein